MSDNASVLTNATTAVERWRLEICDVERQIDVLQVRLELLREHVADVTGERRPRRNKRQWPLAVIGASTAEPEHEPAA